MGSWCPTRLGWKMGEAWRRRGRAGSKLVRRKGPAGLGREVASLTLTSSSSSRLSDRELRLTCALNRTQASKLRARLREVEGRVAGELKSDLTHHQRLEAQTSWRSPGRALASVEHARSSDISTWTT